MRSRFSWPPRASLLALPLSSLLSLAACEPAQVPATTPAAATVAATRPAQLARGDVADVAVSAGKASARLAAPTGEERFLLVLGSTRLVPNPGSYDYRVESGVQRATPSGVVSAPRQVCSLHTPSALSSPSAPTAPTAPTAPDRRRRARSVELASAPRAAAAGHDDSAPQRSEHAAPAALPPLNGAEWRHVVTARLLWCGACRAPSAHSSQERPV